MLKGIVRLLWRNLLHRLRSRHFALFLLPWLIVLAVRPLRLMLGVQVLGSPVGGNLIPDYPWTPGSYDEAESLPAAIAELKRTHPDDVRVQLLTASTVDVPDENTRLQQYDALIRRYPAEVWLVAWRLHETTLFEADTGSTIVTARLGRSREPQNAFFDLVLMQSLFLAQREDEALVVLKEAARKPYFDTHLRRVASSQIEAYQLTRPLLHEEKLRLIGEIYSRFQAPVSAFYILRARQERQRGNHEQALQIYGDLMRLAGKVRDNRDDIYREDSRQDLIWAKAVEGTPYGRPRLKAGMSYARAARLQARRFAAYARHHGRADLAAEAIHEAEATIAEKQRRDMPPIDYRYEIFPHSLQALSWQRVTDRWIMAMGIGGCLLLALCLRLVLFLPLWTPGLRSAPVRLQDRWATLLWCAVATMLLCAYAMVGNQLLQLRFPDEGTFIALSLYFPAVLFAGAIICAGATVWTNRSTVFRARPPEPGFHAAHIPRSLIPPFLTAISWALFVPAILCWIAALVVFYLPNSTINVPLPAALIDNPANTSTTLDYGWFLVGGTLLSIISYFGWLIRWRWGPPPDLKPVAHYAVRWHLKSLGDWMIILSFAYLFVSLMALPPRRAADESLQRFLEQGRTTPAQADKLQQDKITDRNRMEARN